MKTYAFKVIVEPYYDRWHAYCPALSEWAAATWGDTEEEAYRNIQDVAQMVVEGIIEEGTPLPTEGAEPLPEPRVTVAVPIPATS
jgi:predicted RNase H-like HicB family nuclease